MLHPWQNEYHLLGLEKENSLLLCSENTNLRGSVTVRLTSCLFFFAYVELVTYLLAWSSANQSNRVSRTVILPPWTSLDKYESLACQITSSFDNKLCFLKNKYTRLPYKTTYLFVEWGSYLANQINNSMPDLKCHRSASQCYCECCTESTFPKFTKVPRFQTRKVPIL